MAGVRSSPMTRGLNSIAPRPKRQMQAASINLFQKALQQIENRIDKASAPQAAMVYGILRDKKRLDAGEPAEITASYTRQEIAGLDAFAAVLSQTLLQSGKRSMPRLSRATERNLKCKY
jgi:hypothetical protein